METADAHKGDKTPTNFKEIIDSLKPITEPNEVMDTVRSYLRGLPKEVEVQVEQAIAVFVRTFTLMTRTLNGDTLTATEIESLFMSETMMLDLNNNWYRQHKPIIEPHIAHSKARLMTVMLIKNRDADDRHSSDEAVMDSLLASTWEFIPWMIFVARGDMKAYLSATEIFQRMLMMMKIYGN